MTDEELMALVRERTSWVSPKARTFLFELAKEVQQRVAREAALRGEFDCTSCQPQEIHGSTVREALGLPPNAPEDAMTIAVKRLIIGGLEQHKRIAELEAELDTGRDLYITCAKERNAAIDRGSQLEAERERSAKRLIKELNAAYERAEKAESRAEAADARAEHLDKRVAELERQLVALIAERDQLRAALRELVGALPGANDIPELENQWAQGGDSYEPPWETAKRRALALLEAKAGGR